DFLDGRPKYEAIIKEFVDGKGQFAKGLAARIEWLLENEKDEKALYRKTIEEVFNAESPAMLELHTISKGRGEIGLKVAGNNPYFGLINIGDVSSFKTALKDDFEFRSDKLTEPLFPNLSEVTAKPVNILIGARKFIEEIGRASCRERV